MDASGKLIMECLLETKARNAQAGQSLAWSDAGPLRLPRQHYHLADDRITALLSERKGNLLVVLRLAFAAVFCIPKFDGS
jgi:hypothetical protein